MITLSKIISFLALSVTIAFYVVSMFQNSQAQLNLS